MKVHCNFHDDGSTTRDDVKLVTINGRDYLICRDCLNKGAHRDEKTLGERCASRIPEAI